MLRESYKNKLRLRLLGFVYTWILGTSILSFRSKNDCKFKSRVDSVNFTLKACLK